MNLRAYQARFHAALWTDTRSAMSLSVASQVGFRVYRNTVMKGCVDALAANYPAVQSLVGEDWFRAAASRYVRETPPRAPMLMDYGADFAAFLARFAPAATLPYLPAVARLDRFWTEAHLAPDAPSANARGLAACTPAQLGALQLRPHPAARWTWCSEVPSLSLWQINRGTVAMPPGGLADITWCGEGALFTRPGDAVQVVAIPASACRLLDACAGGATFSAAALAALAVSPGLDLAGLVAKLIAAGAFTIPNPSSQPMEIRL